MGRSLHRGLFLRRLSASLLPVCVASMKRPATLRKAYESYAVRQDAVSDLQAVTTSDALLRQARNVLFFIKEGVSETAPFLAERELIRLIAEVCKKVK